MAASKFLPAAGYRNYNNGNANNRGDNGNYWSSSVNGNNAWNLNFNDGNADMNNNNRANGNSVRCVQASGKSRPSVIFPFCMLEEDIYYAYLDARQHKRGTRSQVLFEMHLEDNLTGLCRELRDGTYKPGRSMCFIISDPVQREVFAASFRDRIVHHLIYNYISPVLEKKFIFDSYSCRAGKGTLAGIKRLEHHIRSCSNNFTRPAYVLKLDISGYFMNINRDILYGLVVHMLDGESYSEKELIGRLLRQIIYIDPWKGCYIKGSRSDWDGLPHSKSLFHSPEDCGLPIGNLTSQLFSNVYLTPLDIFVKRTLHIRHYGRYVDDFYLIHNDRSVLKSAIVSIRRFLDRVLHLTLHPNKIYLQNVRNGVSFVGAFIKPYRRYVSHRTAKTFSIRFSVIPDTETASEIRAVLNSYLGYLSHFASYHFRRKFIRTHPWLYCFGWFPVSYRKMRILGGAGEMKPHTDFGH